MKCIIVYFSQSGNTKKVAPAKQKGMGHQMKQCDVGNIEQADPYAVTGHDLISIGGPP